MERLKLLILEAVRPPGDRRVVRGLDRVKVLNDIVSLGAKVRHDSGERLIVIDTSGIDDKVLEERLSGARLASLDDDIEKMVPDLDEHESLFLEALKIRNSASYRRAKQLQTPGETPEEKAMFSAPCTPEV